MRDLTPMYFVHSYMASQVKEANIVSTTNYNGIDIISIINYKNSFGCQFHPEKSGKKGLNLLENFIELSLSFFKILIRDLIEFSVFLSIMKNMISFYLETSNSKIR